PASASAVATTVAVNTVRVMIRLTSQFPSVRRKRLAHEGRSRRSRGTATWAQELSARIDVLGDGTRSVESFAKRRRSSAGIERKSMSIFGNILNKIFHHKPAAAPAPSGGSPAASRQAP